jgi:2-polyprenyl-6-hydroxyphenyl methylase/3-demethylubiquinone-9 3-methyltransferase
MHDRDALKEDHQTHFKFGENWADYSRLVDEDRIQQAEADLLRLLPREDLTGKSFLDIGCGSGLHSLAALRLGVSSVTCIDIDPKSVETACNVIGSRWRGSNAAFRVGNVFSLPGDRDARFDVVYSWGVLHHTGAMWEAITTASQMVSADGHLVIAIYNRTPLCGFWRWEKKHFSGASKPVQRAVSGLFACAQTLRTLGSGRLPPSWRGDSGRSRGMDASHDRLDWLGGYPYESASPVEVGEHMTGMGFRLIRSFNTEPGLGVFGAGCAEYVFRRERAAAGRAQ